MIRKPPLALNNIVLGITTETERGHDAFIKGYHGGVRSLFNRMSHHLSARIGLKTYKMGLERPMISFTFDDIAQSAALVGAAMLEEHDLRGTFYVSSDLIGRHISGTQKATRDEIQELSLKGHEIALHSHSHLPVFSYSPFGFIADLEDNIKILSEFVTLPKRPNFCYPYGITSFGSKFNLCKLTRSARGLWSDVNHTRLDPYFLRSSILDSRTTTTKDIHQLIQQTIEKKGWLIFISHSVGEEDTPLSTPLSHLNLAISLAKQNNFEIVTVNQGLERLLVP